ncbi:MAG: OmpA family protein [Bacteroidota bacterium]
MRANNYRNIFFVISFLLFCLVSLRVEAQDQKTPVPFNGYLYLQPNLGLTQYFGDLNANDFYNKKMTFGGGAILGYQISRVFGLRGQFMAGKLNSKSDAHQKELNSKIWDLTGQMTVNLNEIFNNNLNRKLNLYIFGGAGYIHENSTVDNYDGSLFQSGINDGRTFPIGGGASYRLSKTIDLNLEFGHRVTSQDKEMDFTKAAKKFDQYSYASAGVTFKFLQKDTDNDGIIDKNDLCPETAGKTALAGCPDKDNDGIADKDDACPDVAGKAEFKGCPDTDGDGIIDKEDACPTAAGKKELNGCPDKDGDGIADKDDKCPDAAGKKELAGCPDKDGDGIADKDDACPDVKGLAKFNGCPDTDGDGIADKDDKCPDVAGLAANGGCPEVKKFEIYKVVYFATDKSFVITKYTKDLDDVVGIMNEHSDVSVSVEGHADAQGSDVYNMKLSEKRADYVINYLVKKGVSKDRLFKKFFGESNPVADNRTVVGRAKNRRVEIKTVK